ncbi:class I SAM-dependent methyltransferase [Streptomyces sp. NPDC005283]|uniref:O-methyltransferase n=1 Tax=unclassified Streptomyces TaxID=2593676 RepID=UPI00345173E2
MTTLDNDNVSALLDRLYEDEQVKDAAPIQKLIADGRPPEQIGHEALNEMFEEAYLPIHRDVGNLMYLLCRTRNVKRAVEFGTSFAVSTIYLAAAVKDNGGGQVIGTEVMPSKIEVANRNIAEAGLTEYVEIREGDALKTLADLEGPIDLLLLDAWKDDNLTVLKMLEPVLAPNALVLGDDVSLARWLWEPYLEHVNGPDYHTVELPIGDGLVLSTRLV